MVVRPEARCCIAAPWTNQPLFCGASRVFRMLLGQKYSSALQVPPWVLVGLNVTWQACEVASGSPAPTVFVRKGPSVTPCRDTNGNVVRGRVLPKDAYAFLTTAFVPPRSPPPPNRCT